MSTVNSTNFSAFVFPPLFVALAVITKDVMIDGYPINNYIVLVDIGLNIIAYLLSDVIVQFGLNKMFDESSGESILESGSDIVVQPALHGLLVGLVRPMIHSEVTLFNNPINFMNSFSSGIVYNIVAKYLSSPLVFYFESQ